MVQELFVSEAAPMKARIAEIQDELLRLIRDTHTASDERPKEEASLASRDASITDLQQSIAELQYEITHDQRFLQLEEGKLMEKR